MRSQAAVRLGALSRALMGTPSAMESPITATEAEGPRPQEEELRLRAEAKKLEVGAGARTGRAELPYNNYSGEFRGISATPLVTSQRTDLLPMVSPGPEGLADAEVREFCARGFVVVKPSKSAEFHRANLEEFDRLHGPGGEGYGGNRGEFGIHMDGLLAVYEDPVVAAALRSLLGPGYVMHQHNATHLNQAGATNQSWHKDPYGPEAATRHKHAFRICMALYYPQRTTLDIGPTGIIPSRYSHTVVSSTDCFQTTEVDQPLTVEAGSVVVIHGDTWHRAMRNYSGELGEKKKRYMLKFYFVRTEEPYMSATPSWDHHGDTTWWPVDGDQDDDAAEATWRWLLGKEAVDTYQATAAVPSTASLAEDNNNITEKERVRAIFQCAVHAATDSVVAEELMTMLGSPATEATVNGILLEAWNHSTNEFRGPRRQSKACNPSGTNPSDLDAMHCLAAAGSSVLPVLLWALRSKVLPWFQRAAAAAAIGSIGPGVTEAAGALIAAVLEDKDVWVRRNACESLGYAVGVDAPAHVAEAAAHALVQALEDIDSAESFEYEQSGSYRETVRQAAASALMRLATHPAVPAIAKPCLMEVLASPIPHKLNAVTQWSAMVALSRMGLTEAATSVYLS
eukprot:COSAG02_NODE_1811_length_10794_cov_9.516784_2_plen_625_part_00